MADYQLLQNTDNILSIIQTFSVNSEDSVNAAWKVYLEELAAKPLQPIWNEEENKTSIAQLFVEPDYNTINNHFPSKKFLDQ